MSSMLPSETQQLMRESFAAAAPFAAEIGRAFYSRLFVLEPGTRTLFPQDMERQTVKLMEMLAWMVDHLDRPEELGAALEAAGRRHRDYGVNADHFAPVGSALIHSLRHTLGDRFTDEAEEAWIEGYAYFARGMERGVAAGR